MKKNLLEGKKILIVDDEPDVLDTLESSLAMCELSKASWQTLRILCLLRPMTPSCFRTLRSSLSSFTVRTTDICFDSDIDWLTLASIESICNLI